MGVADAGLDQNAAWQGELAERMEAYRVRRRKTARYAGQAQFSFEDAERPSAPSVAIADRAGTKEAFAFTLATCADRSQSYPCEDLR